MYTCVACTHMLQRVHRDRNERVRAFPTEAGAIKGRPKKLGGLCRNHAAEVCLPAVVISRGHPQLVKVGCRDPIHR
jgi:hypothetical protein